MRSWAQAALASWVVVVALAGSACGRYGPPVRASERAAAQRGQPAGETAQEPGLLPPGELPDGDDPIAPDPEAP